jgi:PAS domain S-box-containing protein
MSVRARTRSKRLPPLALNSWRNIARYLTQVLALAVVYFVAAKIGLALAFETPQVTAIWPPTGIALIALLLFGPRVWPGVFLGAIAAHASAGEPLAVALNVACGNTLTGVIGVLALQASRFDSALERSRDVLALIGVAVLSPLISASVSTAALALGGFVPWHMFVAVWCVSWVGGTLGILMLAPPLFTWFYNPRLVWTGKRAIEFLTYLSLLVATGVIVFALPRTPYPASYVAFPLLIWAGLRMGAREAAVGTCLLSMFALWGALHGYGPFAERSPDERLVDLDAFIAVIGCTALLVSAVTVERLHAQATLRSSRGLLQAVFEHTPAVIYVKDKLGRFLMVNRRFEELFHVTQTVIGKTGYELWSKDIADRFHEMDQRVILARRALTDTEAAPQDDGIHTYISVKCPLWDHAGEPYAVMGISTDITELHQAQEQLHRAHHQLEQRVADRTVELANAVSRLRDANSELEQRNREKETLLKEIHHRVKNNMQVISSLLSLQAHAGEELSVRAFVENSQSRVRSMALVHEHLYRSDDLQSVPMGAYLRAVVEGIKQGQDVGRNIRCEVHADDIALPIDRAIPCGLIVNEVVTNALKHAFPDERTGRVDVSMCETGKHRFSLEIKDDGVGIASEDQHPAESFGLRLVGMLARQLHGNVETEQESGLAFRLQFEVGT